MGAYHWILTHAGQTNWILIPSQTRWPICHIEP